MSIPFGITAIPTSSTSTINDDGSNHRTDPGPGPVSVQFNPSTVEQQLFHNEVSGICVQQPLTDSIAVYESEPTGRNRSEYPYR